jgi:hypothetical protein
MMPRINGTNLFKSVGHIKRGHGRSSAGLSGQRLGHLGARVLAITSGVSPSPNSGAFV